MPITLDDIIAFVKATWKAGVTLLMLGLIAWGAYWVYHHIDAHARAAQLAIDQPIIDAQAATIKSMQSVAKIATGAERVAATTTAVALTTQSNDNWNTYHASTQTANAQLATLIDSVSNRKARVSDSGGSPLGTPGSPGSPTAVYCTGGLLYKDDAEFLAGYAHDAELQSRSLRYCKAEYDTVKNNFNAYRQQVAELVMQVHSAS